MISLFLLLFVITGSYVISDSYAQFQSGGVDKEGSWYAGEGLKQGDYFSYDLCHVDYKECVEFEMSFWIRGDIQVGSETKWLAEVLVYDGSKTIVGSMELGKIAPEPTGGSPELGIYRGAFKSSIAWLSAFATSDGAHGGKGPKEFSDISWGKIGNIGGEQVVPMAIETITVPAGKFEDTVQVGWKTGGKSSKIWIVDDFPFPIKADTYTHVSEGIPPQEYRFVLQEYEENVQSNPFEGIQSSTDQFVAAGCDVNFERDNIIKRSTAGFNYQIHIFYGPEEPEQGCEMQWVINFISKFDDTEYLNQVQFDVLVYEDGFDLNTKHTRSLANEEGRLFLYSPSGQYTLDMVVKEPPGTAHYVLVVYGLAPENRQPNNPLDYLEIEIPILEGTGTKPSPVTPNPEPSSAIPEWVKSNADFWVKGEINDATFISAIQFLISQDVIQVPPTIPTQNSGSDTIPEWVKSNADFWVKGEINDATFISAIQFLISQGIIIVS